jgi:hypothetical protein
LSSSIIGAVEACQQDFEIDVSSDVNAEHFACDTAVEALDHAIGLWGIGPGFAMGDLEI